MPNGTAPLTLLLLVLQGCASEGAVGGRGDGGSGPTDGGPAPMDASDASTVRDAGTMVERDAAENDGAVPGLQCEACTADADCGPASYCVTLPGGGGGSVCLRTCVRDLPSCPPRFDCVDSLIMGREEPVCAPVGERCCVDADGDDHGTGVGCRGLDCDDSAATVNASATETCDGVDEDCDGMVDEDNPGGGLVCSTGMAGACASGVTVCEGGLIVCRPDAAMLDESCDGVDNDCDASVDEDDMGRALTRSCYDGPAGTEGVGACTAGVQTCTGGEYRSCAGQTLPGVETCNGVDDDCDGTVDDGDPGGGIACSSSAPGVCGPGTTSCVGGSVQCVSTVTPGTRTETCNGEDDDCDGSTDEGFMVGAACSVGVGACLRTGSRVCDAAGTGTDCSATAGSPSPETCDGTDNDCDGSVDEDPSGAVLTRACYDGPAGTEGVGLCAAGAQTCTGGDYRSCAGQTLPSAELCNGADDDCDGVVDDGDPGGGIACSSSAPGVCRPGATRCVGGSVQCVSTVAPGTRTETCNGEDDDCDGSSDEGFMVGTACSAGVGACLRTGMRVCDGSGAGTVCSATAGSPGPETCDGLDNDCDGSIDEDATGRALTRPCYDGPAGTAGVGSCSAGVETCAGGSYGSCVGQILPGTETCNGVDEDCDGAIDDGDPGGGIGCTAPVPGVCAAGRTRCTGGAIQCVGDVAPGTLPETCDYVDNDCDGSTDEGFLLGRVCVVGTGECMRSGVTQCNASGSDTECDAVPGAPTAETCDYADNDCDGSTDEGYAYTGDPASPGTPYAIGEACAAGLGTCRRGGVVACAGDGSSAVCTAPAVTGTAETCNYLDDDCDGAVDDGFVDAMGRYSDDRNCGACGFDCTTIYAFPNSFGTCSTSTGAPTCVQNCSPGTFNLNGIPDDGCELVLDPGAIYVSGEDAAAVNDSGCGLGPVGTGAGRYPCRTITYGISRAVATGRMRVLVADALYVENVTLVNGVSLFGGHRADTWEQHVSTTLTSIRGTSGTGHRKTIVASGIDTTTVVEGLVIEGASASSPGASSYAVHVDGGTSALTFRDNVIYAGNGAPGSPGTAGVDGLGGVAGASGLVATETSQSSCTITRTGGAGGVRSCGGTSANGGNGGNAVCAPLRDTTTPYTPFSGRAGSPGSNGGAAGGAAGYDGETQSATSCLTCYLPLGDNTMTGSTGTAGARGSNGGAGSGASSAVGSVMGSEWVGASGATGGAGAHGGGGGGGGSGGGGDGVGFGCYDDLGGTGGGGGSGACGGTQGGGGGAGGGSFGIFIANTTSRPVLMRNTVYRGFGGTGGNGGRGGTGGVGGAGGAGGPKTNANNNFCTGDAGAGGAGGGGGHGGGGGGGAGGVSYAIYATGTTGYGTAGNTLPVSGGGGAGGAGGSSVGSSGGAGVAGVSATTN